MFLREDLLAVSCCMGAGLGGCCGFHCGSVFYRKVKHFGQCQSAQGAMPVGGEGQTQQSAGLDPTTPPNGPVLQSLRSWCAPD